MTFPHPSRRGGLPGGRAHSQRPAFPAARLLGRVLLAGLLLGGSQAVRVSITPVRLDIDPARQLATTTVVTNLDSAPVEFSAELVRWTQQGGQDQTAPTRDGLVNPPRFVVQPGRSQVIRVGLRARPGQPQVTYRLVLRQVGGAGPTAPGPAGGDGQSRVTVTPSYSFSLPLFVTQPGVRAQLSAALEQGPGGLTLRLSNGGTGAALLRDLSVGSGVKVASALYVLAGSAVRVPLPPGVTAGSRLSWHSTDEQGREQRESLDLRAP